MKFYINRINKYTFIKTIAFIKHYCMLWFVKLFNTTVRKQLKDYKSIPIIIISYNQLKYLEQLVNFLLDKKYTNIVILDNNSTYPPLLTYFKEIETKVVVYRSTKNEGHLSFWENEELYKKYTKGYYVITDADIVPNKECPEDFLQTFRQLLDKCYDRTKVGFSLKIDDIPSTNPNKDEIVAWESKYWNSEIISNVYKAPIDTTFALYRPYYKYKLKDFTKAWRTGFPVQAIHGGWYVNLKELTEEQLYYMKTANDSASWQTNEEGVLINKKHKPLYLK